MTLGYRLAANGSSVAIIEGGGFYEQDNANNSQIPALAGTLENYDPQAPSNPLIDWEIITPPQPVGHTLLSINFKVLLTCTKTIKAIARSTASLWAGQMPWRRVRLPYSLYIPFSCRIAKYLSLIAARLAIPWSIPGVYSNTVATLLESLKADCNVFFVAEQLWALCRCGRMAYRILHTRGRIFCSTTRRVYHLHRPITKSWVLKHRQSCIMARLSIVLVDLSRCPSRVTTRLSAVI